MKQQMKQRKRHFRRGVVERDLLFLLLSFDKDARIIVSFFVFFFFFFKWKMTCKISTSEHLFKRKQMRRLSPPPKVCFLSKSFEETNKRIK